MRDAPRDPLWDYTEHARAKHEILRRYLGAWLAILANGEHERLYLVDGFAGRGHYNDGEPGSPVVMFDAAARAVEERRARSVLIRCAEPDAQNFVLLQEACGSLSHPNVTIKATREKFSEIAAKLQRFLGEKSSHPPPVFIFVDPHGSSDVALSVLKGLLDIPRVEVLLTLMVREPSRFLREDAFRQPLTELFGGDSWRACDESDRRPECLMLRFRDVLKEQGVARHVVTFRVFEDKNVRLLYCLVHMTNEPLGMRRMKEAMVKQSGDLIFRPTTLRPPDQLSLEVDEKKPYPTLQRRLTQRYSGRTVTFEGLLSEDYPGEHAWVEPHYRAALKAMEQREPREVTVARARTTVGGRPATGITNRDRLTFPTTDADA